MLDPKKIRTELDETAEKLESRGFELDTDALRELEERRKQLQVKTESLQNERNTKSKSIGKAKAAGEDIQPLLEEVAGLGEKLDAAKAELEDCQRELDDILMGVPNLPHDSALTAYRDTISLPQPPSKGQREACPDVLKGLCEHQQNRAHSQSQSEERQHRGRHEEPSQEQVSGSPRN